VGRLARGLGSLYIGRDIVTVDTREAIAARRSIRRFRPGSVPDHALSSILEAGIQAPSGKNSQPWRFIVVKEDRRQEMVEIMGDVLAAQKAADEDLGSAEWTLKVMAQAPVTVFVYNQYGKRPWVDHSTGDNFQALVNTQSVGAAIQNMLLAALDLGLGSLWICDVLYAYEELTAWLGAEGALVAAVSFGYADESPAARPRKPMSEVVRYM
jgi:nitroreductase